MSDTESTSAAEAPAVAGRLDLGLGPLPEGDRFKDVLTFRRLGAGGGDALYECWGEAVRAYAAAEVAKAVAAERERYEKLQQVWEDTRTQRDELLAHLTRGEPLPAWAVEWIRVYKA